MNAASQTLDGPMATLSKTDRRPAANIGECESLLIRAAQAMGFNANQTHRAIRRLSNKSTLYRRWDTLDPHPLRLAHDDEGDDD